MAIDSHVHIWNIDRVRYAWPTSEDGDLYRNIEPAELKPQLVRAGITGAVLVQAADHAEETAYLLEQAEAHQEIVGVVGWLPLDQPYEARRQLEKYAGNRYFKGVRHLIHCEEDPDWLVRPSVIEGLRVLAAYGKTFDVVAVFPNHLQHVSYVAQQVPELKMVLDHLAKPPIASGVGMERWAAQLEAAAAYPNVYGKLSGLNTACDWNNWSSADWQTSVEVAMRAFGAERLMYGSDWPVANLAGGYERVWAAVNEVLAGLSERERTAVLGGTAAAFYKL
ncbi:amidohydrolase family protein [Paenibacillus sp. PR3]|uniref:Amidohydrolase family protein n=1 Tax=Paenibacillus terricola TaxID=2763503 RepID=A0ABR8N2S6_9BACL|nr:amidohydrolase family protein [Paenibacillus terricola]MBD3922475.1 amidohydrolase family protein [Paenibacillus terricola]